MRVIEKLDAAGVAVSEARALIQTDARTQASHHRPRAPTSSRSSTTTTTTTTTSAAEVAAATTNTATATATATSADESKDSSEAPAAFSTARLHSLVRVLDRRPGVAEAQLARLAAAVKQACAPPSSRAPSAAATPPAASRGASKDEVLRFALALAMAAIQRGVGCAELLRAIAAVCPEAVNWTVPCYVETSTAPGNHPVTFRQALPHDGGRPRFPSGRSWASGASGHEESKGVDSAAATDHETGHHGSGNGDGSADEGYVSVADTGMTLLHAACGLGRLQTVRNLLEHGADVRVVTGAARSTPLHFAAFGHHAEAAALLLASCATPAERQQLASLRDAFGYLPFTYALGHAGCTVLDECAVGLLELSHLHESVTAVQAVSLPLLHTLRPRALRDARAQTCTLLLFPTGPASDFFPRAVDSVDMHRAVAAGHADVVSLLSTTTSADVLMRFEAPHCDGNTPLHLCASAVTAAPMSATLVDRLVHTFTSHAAAEHGIRAFHANAQVAPVDVWRPAPRVPPLGFSATLHGADGVRVGRCLRVREVCADALLPAAPEVVEARRRCCRVLVERGADVHAVNQHGLTPVDVADLNGLVEVSAMMHYAGSRQAVSKAVLMRVVEEKRQCSYAVTLNNDMEQEVWGCNTCNIDVSRGFCKACRLTCHKVGHTSSCHGRTLQRLQLAAVNRILYVVVVLTIWCVAPWFLSRRITKSRSRDCSTATAAVDLVTATLSAPELSPFLVPSSCPSCLNARMGP